MRAVSLPLGVDIGTARLRVAHAVRCGNSRYVRAVATRDVPAEAVTAESIADAEYVAALLEDAVRELNTAQRRCVAAIGMPAASVRSVVLPSMTALERDRTVRFEAARYIEYPITQAHVRLRPIDRRAGLWALGIVRANVLRERVSLLRRAGLRAQAMDDEGCAMRRAFPTFDAVLDVGHHRSSLYLKNSLDTFQTPHGGAGITAGIEKDLRVDESAAEKRKRILGTAGAGERAREALIGALLSLVTSARTVSAVQRIALVGNGVRLPNLARDIESASGARCELAVSHVLRGEPYAADVIASSAADWTLAAALATGISNDVV